MYTNQLHRRLYAHIVTGAFCLICYFDSFIFLCNAIEHVEWEWCFLICSTRKMLCMYRYSQFNAKYAPKVTHTSDKNNRTEESFRFDIEIYPTHIHFKYQKKKNTFFCFVLSNQPHSTPFIRVMLGKPAPVARTKRNRLNIWFPIEIVSKKLTAMKREPI